MMEDNKNQTPNTEDNGVQNRVDDCEEEEIKMIPISEAVKLKREIRDRRNKEYHDKLAELEARKKKLYAELDPREKDEKK
ncbi:hypothetical protein bcgnr5372_46530 [Bacillus luti]